MAAHYHDDTAAGQARRLIRGGRQFGPGLSEKPYIGYYDLAERTLENHARTFIATPGTVLDFEQKVGDTERLFCRGTVVD